MKKNSIAVGVYLFVLPALFALKTTGTNLLIDTNWQYAVENNSQNIVSFDMKPEKNRFNNISFIQLRNLELLLPHKSGVVWLKSSFYVPDDFSQESLACYLGKISMHDQTWLNGVYLGGWGTFEKNTWSYCNKTREYVIPGFLINTGTENTLYVRIFVNQKGSLQSVPKIGPSQIIHKKATIESFIHASTHMLLAGIFIFISLYNLFLFFYRKKERLHLSYALLTFFSALYTSQLYLHLLPGFQPAHNSYMLYQKITSYFSGFLIVFLACNYLNYFFERNEARIIYILRSILILIP
ncbi:MAG TPA: 7TM diverse intracellular signaling domain-containing protein, partial [Treponemataceae bacterium]|nr:7TM diverse intracellular signaling domain-containing protein [Treponemataceae bacterium]